jgi:hypothetical protein
MSEFDDPVAQRLFDLAADPMTEDKDLSAHVKSLKTYAEAKKLFEPDPIPDPEPTGVKAFLNRHAGDLIKVAGTISVVGIIAVIEAKGDIIFRSKASKFI